MLKAYEEAAQLRRTVLKATPDSIEAQSAIAGTLHALGLTHKFAKQTEAAVAASHGGCRDQEPVSLCRLVFPRPGRSLVSEWKDEKPNPVFRREHSGTQIPDFRGRCSAMTTSILPGRRLFWQRLKSRPVPVTGLKLLGGPEFRACGFDGVVCGFPWATRANETPDEDAETRPIYRSIERRKV